MDKLYWPAGRNKYTRTKLDQISVLLLKTRNKNEIRAGKRKSRDAVYVSLGSPEAQRQIITELFRQTVPDYGFCSHARVITFGRAALHLSNQRPERPFSISICERERGGGDGRRKSKRTKGREKVYVLYSPAATISFRLHSHSGRVRSTSATASRPPTRCRKRDDLIT